MKKATLIWLVAFCISNASAQDSSPEIISSAGETYQGTNMQIDWTLGETLITTIQNANLQITQGFHQPNYIITSLEKLSENIGTIKVFPNPTADFLEMNIHFNQERKVQIQLFDLNGKLIWSANTEGRQISKQKELSDLPDGNYVLSFRIDGDHFLQTFKIQKIN